MFDMGEVAGPLTGGLAVALTAAVAGGVVAAVAINSTNPGSVFLK